MRERRQNLFAFPPQYLHIGTRLLNIDNPCIRRAYSRNGRDGAQNISRPHFELSPRIDPNPHNLPVHDCRFISWKRRHGCIFLKNPLCVFEVFDSRLLLSGGTVAGIANSLGTRPETVRGQLKSVFAKTGVHRQAELIQLLGGIQVPGAPGFGAPGGARG